MIERTIPCIICGNIEERRLIKPKSSPGPVVKCRRCGLIYVNPRENTSHLIGDDYLKHEPLPLLTSNNLADLQGRWEKPLIESYLGEFSHKAANASLFLEKIARFSAPPGRMLDLGCFCGVFLAVARDNGWDTYGLEPLPGAALFARAYFGLNVITSTLREGLYPPEYFDTVTAFQVFEHLPNPSAVLSLLRPLIRPGGLLVIEVPNIDTIWFRCLRARTRLFVPDHLFFFSAETLTMFLEKHGFQVVETGFSRRTMSLRWLLGQLPVPLVVRRTMIWAAEALGVGTKTVQLSLGDIVYVFARKDATQVEAA